jgi:hypothetical protein
MSLSYVSFQPSIGAILSSEALFLFCFFSLRGWGAAKISHPIVLTGAVWFFGLGLFPVAVERGQVYFFYKNYVGWVGCGWIECWVCILWVI